jgi:hypothetical protein
MCGSQYLKPLVRVTPRHDKVNGLLLVGIEVALVRAVFPFFHSFDDD